jgi:hypothetical protein
VIALDLQNVLMLISCLVLLCKSIVLLQSKYSQSKLQECCCGLKSSAVHTMYSNVAHSENTVCDFVNFHSGEELRFVHDLNKMSPNFSDSDLGRKESYIR